MFRWCNIGGAVKLFVVHHHFRPGGVRRVIELATPQLVATLKPRVDEAVLVAGEAPDAAWLRQFKTQLVPAPVTCRIEPSLSYLAEQRLQPRIIACRLRRFLEELLRGIGPGEGIVWAHNQSLGRNLVLTRELALACAARQVPLVLHHHDWWFDNRWARWAEMRRARFRTLAQAAKTVFASGPNVHHVAINQADAAILRHHFPQQSGWLPNLTVPAPPPPSARVRQARRWLCEQLGDAAPVWLLPCRLLRRKNIAEALLLTRWLRPEAWLVTTGGISSTDEQAYASQIKAAARRHGWRLRLGILQHNESAKPTVAELLAVSETVLLTSIQEGFGLPYLEAAAAQRPLIARRLTNIAPDLAQFGFRFPQYYEEILVRTDLFDWKVERSHQMKLFRAWLKSLPRPLHPLAGKPVVLASRIQPAAVPFSRLTLMAQLEVLAQPTACSWELCAPLNPFLKTWRDQASRERLQVTCWPRTAKRWLSAGVYAERFLGVLQKQPSPSPGTFAAVQAQAEFIRKKLASDNLYPLLWDFEI